MGKGIIILWIVSFSMFSCKTVRQPSTIPIQYKEKIVERLVPVQLPADSSSIKALLDCNDKNQVILKELSEAKSQNVQSQYSFANGILEYKTKSKPPIAHIPVRDTTIYKEIPVPYPVETKVNYLTGWQWAQVWAGRVLLALIFLYILYTYIRFTP